MDSGLPSKKIFFLIVACIVSVSAIGFAVYSTKGGGNLARNQAIISGPGGSGAAADANSPEQLQKAFRGDSELDNDADGLLNWEETLWGTKPNDPDTDNDGTKDGDETKENRNPVKAGPNDKLATTVTSPSGANGANRSAKTADDPDVKLENTETAKISRDLFASYIEAKRLGLPIDAETQTKIIERAFANKTVAVVAKQFSASEITTAGVSDLKKYGNDLGLAFLAGAVGQGGTSSAGASTVSEIEILHEALTNQKSEIARLDPIIAGYTAILNKLAAVAVPRELVGQHLVLLNSVSQILADIKSFRVMFDDPMVGLAGVNNYYTDVGSMHSAIGAIGAVFTQAGIVFGQDEYGYAFVKTI